MSCSVCGWPTVRTKCSDAAVCDQNRRNAEVGYVFPVESRGILEEREGCAKIVEEFFSRMTVNGEYEKITSSLLAAKIRSRTS